MELSLEKRIAFDKYVQGNNIFITGPGGTGKSALIKTIYKYALTGCASVLLNCRASTFNAS